MENEQQFALELSERFDKDVVAQHFTQCDIKLLKLILSQIKGDKEEYLFHFDQLESLGFNLETENSELFSSLKKIADYYVNIQNGYGDYYQMGLIKNKFTIDQEMQILSVKIHKELVPFLNSLKKQYVPQIDIDTIT